MHPHLSVDHLVLAGAGLLAAGVVMSRLADRIRVPGLLLFLGLGMAVGDDGLAWVHFGDPHLAQNLCVVALILILFDGGLSSSPRLLRQVVAPASVLATVGVFVSAVITGVAAMWLLHVSFNTALLVGAVVASTDAAAVFSVLRGAPIPERLDALLETESGGNDPAAVLLTVGLLATYKGGVTAGDWVIFGVQQLAGGLIVGVVVGYLGSRILVRTSGSSAAPLVGLATAAGCYGVAAWLGASGFLAVFVGGVLMGAVAPSHGKASNAFHSGLASLAQLGLFFLLGILVFPSQLGGVAWRALAIAAVLLFIARPVAVAASVVWFRIPWRSAAFVSWAGLRGAVPIVLATFPLTAHHPDGSLVFDVVFFVVLVSATVQGATVVPVARWLGLRHEPGPWDPIVDVVPMDQFGVELLELELNPTSPVVGRAIAEVPMPGDARIITIIRDGRVVLATGSTVLDEGDHLAVAGGRSHNLRDALSAWAGGDDD
ncbi:MAG TPA: potassium/proton antiporter [Acidimicrobiales bacterium]|nr:potassium/proton antiporter [Acidimicrobiales bacterium]